MRGMTPSRRRPAVVLGALVITACGGGTPPPPDDGRLGALPIDPAAVTVSGISAGGAMGVQFHVAYSDLVRGTGVLGASPYLCAENSMNLALGRCMKGDEPIPTDRLVEITSRLALDGLIDPIAGLAADRVWIYHGAADPYVSTPVVDALEDYYQALVDPANVTRIEQPDAGHAFPTTDATAPPCTTFEEPYISNCDLDGARALLEHLYGPLADGAPPRPEGLVEFDQRPYAELAGSGSLAERGWLYVPAACAPGATGSCRLHVVLHGCRQGASFIGDRFIQRAGYLQLAERNAIVLLFPQIEPSLRPLNPMGCWDWWGYEGEDYATQAGRQLRALRTMVGDLLGEGREAR